MLGFLALLGLPWVAWVARGCRVAQVARANPGKPRQLGQPGLARATWEKPRTIQTNMAKQGARSIQGKPSFPGFLSSSVFLRFSFILQAEERCCSFPVVPAAVLAVAVRPTDFGEAVSSRLSRFSVCLLLKPLGGVPGVAAAEGCGYKKHKRKSRSSARPVFAPLSLSFSLFLYLFSIRHGGGQSFPFSPFSWHRVGSRGGGPKQPGNSGQPGDPGNRYVAN